MTAQNAHCSDDDLSVLLDGAEDSGDFRKAASHVESCPQCQRRLTELSGDANYWKAQHAMLQPIDSDHRESGHFFRYRSHDSTEGRRCMVDETSVRQLLAAPSHPEMLGRLGRYEIERVIGTGGMGIVLKGFDSELNRPVAIKLLAPHLARIGAARQRFAREARAAAAVVHEHVVPIHNVESDDVNPFLVMQFIPGESLQSRVEREGPLSVREILRIGMQAAAGLAAAHAQGLVHRDVKPANILLEHGVERAFLTDFGLARASDDASLTYTGAIAGTPHYMSPEQADGQPLDHRSDLFSLGSVLYFMATGHPPFRAASSMAVLKRTCHDPHRPACESNPDVPDSLSVVIDQLLAKSPAKRLNSAADLQKRLASVLSDVQQGKLGRPRRRSLGRLAMQGVGIAMVAIAGMFVGWHLRDRNSPPNPRPSVLQPISRKPLRPRSSLEELHRVDPTAASDVDAELEWLSKQVDDLQAVPFPEPAQE
jgi:serine/threonine protein kinase